LTDTSGVESTVEYSKEFRVEEPSHFTDCVDVTLTIGVELTVSDEVELTASVEVEVSIPHSRVNSFGSMTDSGVSSGVESKIQAGVKLTGRNSWK
jgi:hypothetical protein